MDMGSLFDMLRGGKVLDLPLAKKLASDVLTGLVFLHCKKIGHRDIKPENILVSREWGMRAKIGGEQKDIFSRCSIQIWAP